MSAIPATLLEPPMWPLVECVTGITLDFHRKCVDYSPKEPSLPKYPPEDYDDVPDPIPIDRYLGVYFTRGRQIRLYPKRIKQAAEKLKCSYELLEAVVEIHEIAHALSHYGIAAAKYCAFSASGVKVRVNERRSRLKARTANFETLSHRQCEGLAQAITYRVIKDGFAPPLQRDVMTVFLTLMSRQPRAYQLDSAELSKAETVDFAAVIEDVAQGSFASVTSLVGP